MWYPTPLQDQFDQAPPTDTVAAVGRDLRALRRADVESSEPGPATNTPALSTADAASASPGSEYWLP